MPILVHLSKESRITKFINRLKSGGESGPPCWTTIGNSKSSSGVWASAVVEREYSDSNG